jgi:hypothetical protein
MISVLNTFFAISHDSRSDCAKVARVYKEQKIYFDAQAGRQGGRDKGWQIRSSGKSQADRGQHILSVFSGSRNVTTDLPKYFGNPSLFMHEQSSKSG